VSVAKLTTPQEDVLHALSTGPATMRQLAGRCRSTERRSLGSTVNALMRRGLVTVSTYDRFLLTEKGRRRVA
jgi:hypothetical protein